MTDAELYALIQSDPAAVAAYNVSDDDACAARCSAIAPSLRQPVDAAKLRKILAVRDRWGGLQRVANNFASPDPPYKQARTLIDLITAGDSIDVDEPAVADGAPVLVQHGLLDATDLQAISALANVPQTITQQQVGAAREWFRVTGGLTNATT
jgi:hypothetical protein